MYNDSDSAGPGLDGWRARLHSLPSPDEAMADAARERDSQLTKPPGSLGRLEEIAAWLAAWQGQHPAVVDRPRIAVFAGNHGVTAQGISAFPSEVTVQMVANFEAGGAAINQLADVGKAELRVVPLELDRPTADFTDAPAMTEAEVVAALEAGAAALDPTPDILLIGEMGIGNTTSAAALCAALFGGSGRDWAGPGSGLDEPGIRRKAEVIDQALALHMEAAAGDALELLRRLGGREIAAMAGAVLTARENRVPVILDGFVASAAAGVLASAQPGALDHCLAGHVSAEPGHRRLLADLSLDPLLDLGMRLGEASGAAVALAVVKAAAATHAGMATFAEAGVSNKED